MTTKPAPPRAVKQIKVNAITYAQLIKYMLEGMHSCQELAELTGLHYVTVLQYTRELYAAGAAHIGAWEKDDRERDVIKIYRLGPGKDAKRERMTQADRASRYRAKKAQLELIQMMAG